MHQLSTTFEEHIEILAAESPPALILEWGRRLEWALLNYRDAFGIQRMKSAGFFEVLSNDPLVGKEVATLLVELRHRRNAVAHVDRSPISPEEAKEFARKAEDIVWILGKAQDSAEEGK